MYKKEQAIAPQTQYFDSKAFNKIEHTEIRWLGNGGAFINSRGTKLMIDPLLQDFDMPLLVDMPIKGMDVPHLDAVLLTHSDNDHYNKSTCKTLNKKCDEFHAPHYVASLLEEENINSIGHDINDLFYIKEVSITLSAADHAWQNERKIDRFYKKEDFCGYWIKTKDGIIWMQGDSRLLPEQLTMPTPNVILFDFSDSVWHIGLEGAQKMASAYPKTPLLLIHWGCVDAPNMPEFNADPEELKQLIVNPERIKVMAPGAPFILKNRKD